MFRLRGIVLATVVCAAAGAQPAAAEPPLGLGSCSTVEEVVRCDGTVPTWDGVPLDVTVTLPVGAGRGLPLVVLEHGFGNSKHEYLDPASTAYTDNAYGWARDGYAVLTATDRGLWGSCGTPESRLANPVACADGYIHLADTRYEVRDTQELVGRLVDQGVVDPARIGVTGDSYGGGQTFQLAALRDRMMLPDGTLVPWRSPAGVPLRLAAAAPVIPWTSLVGAIAPNGRTRATEVTPPGAESQPVGVFKLSIASAIFAAAQLALGPGQEIGEPFLPGRPMGYLVPPGLDPQSDVTTWVARSLLGEPYTDPVAEGIVSMLERHHSAYGIDPASPPPPLFVGAGFTDDIFPVDETLRFVNRMRRDHPGVPVSLLFGDFGHQRAANKPAERERLIREIHLWFDHHVRGDGPDPGRGVTATTQTCPQGTPSEGPFRAATFAGLSRGELRFSSPAAQRIAPGGGNPLTALAIDPAAGGGDGCVRVDDGDAPGTATYRLPAATGAGFTLIGAPEVTARLEVRGGAPSDAQVAARLWDSFEGRQRLVARGTYRPAGEGAERWELHPNGWRFGPGHVPKLELLGSDAPYARPSNAPFSVEVAELELRLPTREASAGGGGAPNGAGGAPPGAAIVEACRRRKAFKVRVPRKLRRVRVTVQGRRVPVRGRRARIDPSEFSSTRLKVKVTGRRPDGRPFKRVRRHRACARL